MKHALDRNALKTGPNIRRGLLCFAVLFAIMAAFLSADLQSAAYDLPVSDVTESLVVAADTWHGWMETIGAAAVTQTVVEAVGALHGAQF